MTASRLAFILRQRFEATLLSTKYTSAVPLNTIAIVCVTGRCLLEWPVSPVDSVVDRCYDDFSCVAEDSIFDPNNIHIEDSHVGGDPVACLVRTRLLQRKHPQPVAEDCPTVRVILC